MLAQLGWVAHFDACAERHEYEIDAKGLPVRPTLDELERAAQLDMIADQLFEQAAEQGFEGGTDAAFGYLVDPADPMI
jgi:hypothetical protein